MSQPYGSSSRSPPRARTASSEQVEFNAPHTPTEKAFEAFEVVQHKIKAEIVKSRHDWDIHEPRMWSRAAGISNEDLVAFTIRGDLVECRSGPTSYGTIILGKIKLPAVNDEEGQGYIHVRCVRPSCVCCRVANQSRLVAFTTRRTG